MSSKLIASKLNQVLTLQDGRRLGFAEVGDPYGTPVFHFHGWPSSRLEADLLQHAVDLRQLGTRLIAVDRPGIGLSDFQPGRRVLDWPEDVLQLADSLGIQHFAVQGWSGGGPYVAACAYQIPERLNACSFIAAIGPTDVGEHHFMTGFRYLVPLARRAPRLLPGFTWLLWGRSGHDQTKMEAGLKQIQDLIAPRDRELYSQPETRRLIAAQMVAGFVQGSRGMAHDAILLGRHWGFKLEDIRHPKVYIWHGDKDTNVPPSFARVFERSIPNARAKFYPDDGHLSILYRHGMEILNEAVKQSVLARA